MSNTESSKTQQDKLLNIFNALKPLLQAYQDPLKPTFDLEGRYELWTYGNFEILGKKRSEFFFAGLIIQSSYVGLYFMPIYVEPALREVINPELLKCLKGKSCFHIKKTDEILLEQIKEALEKGYALYQQRGWVL